MSCASPFNRLMHHIGIITILMLVGLLLACGNLSAQDREDRLSGVASIRTLTPRVSSQHSIGELAKVGNLSVFVKGVRTTDGRDNELRIPTPSDGNVYLVVDLSLENVGNEFEQVASRMQVSLFDSKGQTQEWALFPAAAGSIDGRIDPGREKDGALVWEVRADAEELTMVFGSAAFDLGDASGYRPGSPDEKLSVN